jgi:AraC-like DNA-binding protein
LPCPCGCSNCSASSPSSCLNPDLAIEELSGQLSVPVKVLSRVINESLGQSFFYFVNTYRVEEAKQLLTNASDPKITVPEVMDQAGFNSKSSSNTAFKKIALTTPGDYKKKGIRITRIRGLPGSDDSQD